MTLACEMPSETPGKFRSSGIAAGRPDIGLRPCTRSMIRRIPRPFQGRFGRRVVKPSERKRLKRKRWRKRCQPPKLGNLVASQDLEAGTWLAPCELGLPTRGGCPLVCLFVPSPPCQRPPATSHTTRLPTTSSGRATGNSGAAAGARYRDSERYHSRERSDGEATTLRTGRCRPLPTRRSTRENDRMVRPRGRSHVSRSVSGHCRGQAVFPHAPRRVPDRR